MTHTEFSRKGGLTMTPEKLAALQINAAKARAKWKEMRGTGKLASKFVKVTSSHNYQPSMKAPSHRDRWREEVAERKRANAVLRRGK